jgi:hypothetical protein
MELGQMRTGGANFLRVRNGKVTMVVHFDPTRAFTALGLSPEGDEATLSAEARHHHPYS